MPTLWVPLRWQLEYGPPTNLYVVAMKCECYTSNKHTYDELPLSLKAVGIAVITAHYKAADGKIIGEVHEATLNITAATFCTTDIIRKKNEWDKKAGKYI